MSTAKKTTLTLVKKPTATLAVKPAKKIVAKKAIKKVTKKAVKKATKSLVKAGVKKPVKSIVKKAVKDLNTNSALAQNVQKLERLIASLKAKKPLQISVSGKRVNVPASAKFNIAYEKNKNACELGFQLAWKQ